MNSHFYVFKVSKGDHDWNHALFLNGQWYAFNWGWYCDVSNDEIMGSNRADPSLWDGCISHVIPAEDVKWAVPESDSDDGPYYTYLHNDWVQKNLGIILPD
jgi:hypothetical protein